MKIFKDATGHDWTIQIHVGNIKKVKDLTGVDLLAIKDMEVFSQLADPIKLVDTLFVLCQNQAIREGISDEGFAERLVGDAIESATKALLDELLDFFPQKRSAPLKKLLEATEKVEEKRLENMTLQMQDPKFLEEMEVAIEKSLSFQEKSSGQVSTSGQE